MNKGKFAQLIGITKQEVIAQLGQEYNYLHSDVWQYPLNNKKSIFSKVLYLYFEGGVVVEVKIKKKFFI